MGVFFILLGGFLLVGQNYALLLALGLAILDFIPIIGVGHRYGALGGGGSVYPGFLHRCLSDGDLGGGGHVPPGGGATVRGRPRPACPLSCPWWASTWA